MKVFPGMVNEPHNVTLPED
jgi:hypothetical protein